jgi:predicted O-methyltransferase YrrM
MGTDLKRKADKCDKIEENVELIFGSSRIHPSFPWKLEAKQVKYEITQLMKMVEKIEPKFILEIGTSRGGTLFLLTRVSRPDATIISIDLLTNKYDSEYPWWKTSFYKTLARNKQRIHISRKDSHLESTLNDVKTVLKGNKLDFVFIDGDHRYDGVKKDFEMYHKLVRKGGLIAFHDICKTPNEVRCEVEKFWSEIKNSYENVEIIEEKNQKWAGIGVLRV